MMPMTAFTNAAISAVDRLTQYPDRILGLVMV